MRRISSGYHPTIDKVVFTSDNQDALAAYLTKYERTFTRQGDKIIMSVHKAYDEGMLDTIHYWLLDRGYGDGMTWLKINGMDEEAFKAWHEKALKENAPDWKEIVDPADVKPLSILGEPEYQGHTDSWKLGWFIWNLSPEREFVDDNDEYNSDTHSIEIDPDGNIHEYWSKNSGEDRFSQDYGRGHASEIKSLDPKYRDMDPEDYDTVDSSLLKEAYSLGIISVKELKAGKLITSSFYDGKDTYPDGDPFGVDEQAQLEFKNIRSDLESAILSLPLAKQLGLREGDGGWIYALYLTSRNLRLEILPTDEDPSIRMRNAAMSTRGEYRRYLDVYGTYRINGHTYRRGEALGPFTQFTESEIPSIVNSISVFMEQMVSLGNQS